MPLAPDINRPCGGIFERPHEYPQGYNVCSKPWVGDLETGCQHIQPHEPLAAMGRRTSDAGRDPFQPFLRGKSVCIYGLFTKRTARLRLKRKHPRQNSTMRRCTTARTQNRHKDTQTQRRKHAHKTTNYARRRAVSLAVRPCASSCYQ